jgi:hypothetical protein
LNFCFQHESHSETASSIKWVRKLKNCAAELEARVKELERLLSKVTMENEFLKKAVRNSLKQAQKKEGSLPKIAPSSKTLKGGAN